ncbi:ciliary microtubule-associated protein 2 [Porphyrio hochstetteri]
MAGPGARGGGGKGTGVSAAAPGAALGVPTTGGHPHGPPRAPPGRLSQWESRVPVTWGDAEEKGEAPPFHPLPTPMAQESGTLWCRWYGGGGVPSAPCRGEVRLRGPACGDEAPAEPPASSSGTHKAQLWCVSGTPEEEKEEEEEEESSLPQALCAGSGITPPECGEQGRALLFKTSVGGHDDWLEQHQGPMEGPQLPGAPGDMGSQGNASAPGWARAEEGSCFCQWPHFQFKEIMKRRRRQQERLSPALYNIRSFLEETRPSSLRGICDTREQRFRDTRDCFPGPGTYGPQGNPYTRLEERDKRSTSTRGLMDSRTAKCALPTAEASPAPCPGDTLGSSLGPCTYHLRSSIGEGLQRSGGRGSCQPFSGDRWKPTGGGHHTVERKGTELSSGTVKGFLDELTSRESKKKGCFSTLPRNPGCPTERIFWATLSQCPREVGMVGPGSYDPKPIERSTYSNQPPFWSSAKRFDRRSYRLFTGNEQHQQHIAEPVQNPVGVGRYDITKHENCPQKLRYQSLYQCDAQRYLSNLKRDAYLLERLKPPAKKPWSHLLSAPPCPATYKEVAVVSRMIVKPGGVGKGNRGVVTMAIKMYHEYTGSPLMQA